MCASKLFRVRVRAVGTPVYVFKGEKRRDVERDHDSGNGHRPGGSLTPSDDKQVQVETVFYGIISSSVI